MENSSNPKLIFALPAYLVGLSFTNHLQTVLFFPTLFLFFLVRRNDWGIGSKEFATALLFFLLGLSIYLYLPIRSANSPLANWGATSELDNFRRHVSGWQYRVWMFQLSSSQVWENFLSALKIIAGQFHLLSPLLFLIGLIFCKNSKVFLWGLLLLGAVTICYNINYDINDIDVYYLPAVFVLYLLGGVGALSILARSETSKQKSNFTKALTLLLALFFTINSLASGWAKADRSQNHFAQEAVENIYQSGPNGGLIFTAAWDHYAPWLYNHFVLGKRPDLIMLDISLARYSWYLDFLKQAYPDFVAGSEKQMDSARALIHQFEKGLPFNSAVIEAAYQSMLASILRQNIQKHPVYFDVSTHFDSAAGWFSIPEGVLFRLYPKLAYYPFETPRLDFPEAKNSIFLEDPIVRREVESLNRMLDLRRSYEAAAASFKSNTGNK